MKRASGAGGEASRRQPSTNPSSREWNYAFSPAFFAPGGYAGNPMGFPNYEFGYWGTYPTYRYILTDPIVRLARLISVGPQCISNWEYEFTDTEDKRNKDSWIKLVAKNLDPIRDELMEDFYVRGRDMGWAGGEPIWDYDSRHTEFRLQRVKPLLQDVTEVLRDKNGNFTGLRNNVEQSVELAAPFKAWKFSYDAEGDDPYGRSWLENIRSGPWMDKLDCMQQLQRLGAKIAGIVTIVKSPAGTFPGPPDTQGQPTKVSYREAAEKLIRDLANGAVGGWIPAVNLEPNARGGIDVLKLMANLAGKSLIDVQLADFSGQAAAMTPILERLKNDDEGIFAGAGRSSRTGLEGKHGTKEEAGVHTDTGTIASEMDDNSFARACQPLVDSILVANEGEIARGAVRINPPSLTDRKNQLLKAMLLALTNVPEAAVEIANSVDLDKAFKALGVATKKAIGPIVLQTKTASSQEKPGTPEPQGGRPKE